jgi:hypothetical protein
MLIIIMIISHSLNGLDIIYVTMQLVCSHYVYTWMWQIKVLASWCWSG